MFFRDESRRYDSRTRLSQKRREPRCEIDTLGHPLRFAQRPHAAAPAPLDILLEAEYAHLVCLLQSNTNVSNSSKEPWTC
jgi:hypothetical protein